MHRRRMKRLIQRLVELVPDDKFDMNHVWEEFDCGSCGCVMGFMPKMFPRSGFTLEKYRARPSRPTSYWLGGPLGCSNFVAMARFLHISSSDSELLFGILYHEEETPKDTAHRLDYYMRTGIAR